MDILNIPQLIVPLDIQYISAVADRVVSSLRLIFSVDNLILSPSDTGVSTYAVNPGATRTGLGRHLGMNKSYISSAILKPLWWLAMKTPEEGAQTVIFAAVEPEIATISGQYWE